MNETDKTREAKQKEWEDWFEENNRVPAITGEEIDRLHRLEVEAYKKAAREKETDLERSEIEQFKKDFWGE